MSEDTTILGTLKKELDDDLAIDHTKLQLEAANNPILYSKWAYKLADYRRKIIIAESERKNIHKNKLDFYTGRSEEPSMDIYDKSEMKVVLSADEQINKIDTKIALLGVLMDFCSKATDAVKSRGFSIKYIIELRQFEAGK